MMNLLIASPGEAPLEGFLLMGASDKDAGDPNTIGMFGSGIKYSIAQLARVGRLPVVYLGTTKLEFGLRETQVRAKTHQEIHYRVDGGGWKSYGAVVQMGERDWQDFWMPVREFVSNALDEVGGNPAGIRVGVEAKPPRAKAGETRVWIPWGQGEGDEALAKAQRVVLEELGKLFLHFRPGGNQLRQEYGPIEKTSPGPARFFRRGVLVRQWSGGDEAKQSLWDYNFKDLEVDEARKASDWDLAYKVGQLLTANPKVYVDMAMKLGREDAMDWWEGRHLNQYSLRTWDQAARAGITAELQERLGDRGVLAASEESARIAKTQGLVPVVLPLNWVMAVEDMQGPTVGNRLGELARMGRQEEPATAEMQGLVGKWCARVEGWGLAGGAGRPEVVGFREPPSKGMTKGQYSSTKKQVQLNMELGGEDLEMTILEELAHHYSGQTDFTRGFQEWLLRVVMKGQGDGPDPDGYEEWKMRN